MRQVVLDTETTGLEVDLGHRVVEVGCVELINRRLTGRNFHKYLNPQREIDDGALEVHGITEEFLSDKPLFKDIWAEFYQFVKGADLIIHNAPFDVAFLDHEIRLLSLGLGSITDDCQIVDSLEIAREKHPGQRNNLDALCRRYSIDNSHRTLHGALLDAEILSDVYLLLTGGQTQLFGEQEELSEDLRSASGNGNGKQRESIALKEVKASPDELHAHEEFLLFIQEKSSEPSIWKTLHQESAPSK